MLDKIIKIISEQLNVPASKITAESTLMEDLGADSLDMVELLMAFEDEFGTSISDDVAINIKTVSDIVRLIEK